MSNYEPLRWSVQGDPLAWSGITIFRSDLIGKHEVICEKDHIVIGAEVDVQTLLFSMNLTEFDKELLARYKVAF